MLVYGVVAALASATAYGVTVVIGRSLARDGLRETTALGIRFAIGAAVLIAIRWATAGTARVLPVEGERLRVFLLGFVGYGLESTLFFTALQRGTAAAVALIFYSYPAIVTVIELATRAIKPSPALLTAVVMSAAGVVLVVTSGDDVSITGTGVLLAVGSAVTFSLYFLASHRLVRRTEPLVNAAWVGAGCALSFLVRGVALGSLDSPSGHWPLLIAFGLANAVAFGGMFVALQRLGPTRTAVLMTFEAVASVVLAALFLDEPLRLVQGIGGIAIAAAAVIVARVGAPVEPEGEPVPVPDATAP